MEKYGPYTELVIKHFKKPHNYGRMKDPSGIGKVGNLVCVLPSTNIFTNGVIRPIEKISQKNYVLSHDGKYNSVKNAYRRKYTGKIIKLKNKFGSVTLTPEHLVLAIKVPKRWKFSYMKNKKQLKSAWYHVEDLERGDILPFPILNEFEDTQKILLSVKKPKYDFKSKKLPKTIRINPDFLRLCGYFLAEGHTQNKMCRTSMSFTFNINEEKYAKEVTNIVKKIFNLDAKIRRLPECRTIVVAVHSARLARFFRKLFGYSAANKRIPHFMMLLPPEKQKSLICGIWRGDGYISDKRPRAEFSTISSQLAQQLKILLLRQRIAPSVYEEEEKIVKGVRHKKCYRVHIGDKLSLIKLARILKTSITIKKETRAKWWFDSRFIYLPVSKKETNGYNGYVHNLEVENSNSFVSESATLHNCGDVMWLYIKVEKDKKGKEIIKDIKFETFGCVAAISTSSVITDLAKGKTIEEAMKIDRGDVIKSLGGLPPIKLHCSVLAADALSESIYDYFSRNKRPIPKELKERHERIEKEKNEIERRYKDWVEMEEKMHRGEKQ